MADIVSALYAKRSKLANAKSAILREAKERAAEIDREIDACDKALKTINSAIEDLKCPRCNGTGSVRRCDGAGQMEDCVCAECAGTGIKM